MVAKRSNLKEKIRDSGQLPKIQSKIEALNHTYENTPKQLNKNKNFSDYADGKINDMQSLRNEVH